MIKAIWIHRWDIVVDGLLLVKGNITDNSIETAVKVVTRHIINQAENRTNLRTLGLTIPERIAS